jgi:hypothetical protein
MLWFNVDIQITDSQIVDQMTKMLTYAYIVLTPPGTDVMILKIFFAEKFGKKISLFHSQQS